MKIFLNKANNEKNMIRILPLYTEFLEKDFGDMKNYIMEEELNLLSHVGKNKIFEGKSGDLYCTSFVKEEGLINTIFVGLGEMEKASDVEIEKAISTGFNKAKEFKTLSVDIFTTKNNNFDNVDFMKIAVESAFYANYDFDKYKSEKAENNISVVNIIGIPDDKLEVGKNSLEEAMLLAKTTKIARDLVNEPSNAIYPKTLAAIAKDCSEEYGFEIDVLKKDDIKELGMKAFLEVSKGAGKSPRLIVMRYFGDVNNKSKILGLIGKGLTYDSGGYSIKPTGSMESMKTDMAGSASVIGAISSMAKMKLKVNVVAVVAACENLISKDAYKPGEVIGSMSGKTIEVVNTDAEGRLTLADAVHYAITKENVSHIVDIATLTGAVITALGDCVTGALTNNEEFFSKIKNASKESREKVWELPSFDEYKELFKSDIGDLKNVGGKSAGTITAGLFIKEFVQDKPWVHLDIAGTSWLESSKSYKQKGATGVGVKILYYLAKNIQEW